MCFGCADIVLSHSNTIGLAAKVGPCLHCRGACCGPGRACMLISMGAHVQEWVKRYRQDRVKATAEALTLLVQVLAPVKLMSTTPCMRQHLTWQPSAT